MGKKSTNVEAAKPDPLVGQAAAADIEISKDWLALTREQYNEGLKRQDVTDALTGKVVAQQLATQDQANTWAQEDRTRTKEVFQPLQDQFIETAQNYDSPEKQAAAAATAKAGIAQSAAAQQMASQRSMASMGVNPNSGRFAGVSRAGEIGTALASAGSANAARTQVQDKALALRADAINMGNGLASSTAAAYGIGTNAGNSAVGNNGASNANFYANGAAMNAGYGGAANANASAGGMLNTQYGIQQQGIASANAANSANNGSVMSGIGSLAGAGVSLFL